jgi:hypothetical protein
MGGAQRTPRASTPIQLSASSQTSWNYGAYHHTRLRDRGSGSASKPILGPRLESQHYITRPRARMLEGRHPCFRSACTEPTAAEDH